MPSRKNPELPKILRERGGLLLAIILGVLASYGAALQFEHIQQKITRAESANRRDLSQQILVKGLRTYEHAVFSLRLVAANNVAFAHSEFLGAARTLIKLNPGISCLQWVADVPEPVIPSFLESVRATVRPDFELQQRTVTGQLGPLDTGSLTAETGLSVITYIYPIAGNEKAYGYNVREDLSRRENEASRTNGEIMATHVFPLVEGYTGMVLTAYTNRPPASLQSPPPQYGSGFAQAVLRLDTILEESLDPASWQDMDFALFDMTDGTPVPLYTHLSNQAAPALTPLAYANFASDETELREFTFGGRRWVAAYRSPSPGIWPLTSASAWLIFAVGLISSQLAVAYLWILIRRNEDIRQEVAIRTTELSDSRALLDLIIDHNPCSIWMKDNNLRILLVNQTFLTYYDRPKAEIIGLTDEDLHSPEAAAEMQAIDRAVLASGLSQRYELKSEIEGKTRYFLTLKFCVKLSQSSLPFLVGIAHEITDLREAEAKRLEIERKMQETQKLESLGVLSGGIAHDFNNILTSILGHAGLVRTFPGVDPRLTHSIEQIELAARRAGELCQQMLAYAGRHRVNTSPLDLGQLIHETLPLLQVSLPKSARFGLKLTPNLPNIIADTTQLRQVVMNLLINAAEALPPAGGEITVTTSLVQAGPDLFAACVHQPDCPAGPYVCLEVTDTGIGMSAETLAKIFEPFFTTKFTGRGLGLAALLGIIRSHQGAIRVISQPGAGTSFFLYLPASSAPTPTPTQAMPPASTAKPTILLVEDEPSVRETTRLMLESFGCTVDTAHDGSAGIALFRQNPARPTIVLLDLTMPGLTGREVFAELRAVNPALPILLMSGYSELDAEDLLLEPKTDFIAKPFTLRDLREKILGPRLA